MRLDSRGIEIACWIWNGFYIYTIYNTQFHSTSNRTIKLYIGRINVSWVKVTTPNVNMYELSWARTLYILIKVLQQITCSFGLVALLVVGLVVDDGWFRLDEWISDTSEWSMDFLMKMENFVVFHQRKQSRGRRKFSSRSRTHFITY